MRYLLGIDGGGTHTTACVANENLSIVSRGQSGPSNPIKVGVTNAKREIERACRQALRRALVSPSKLGAVCAGLAGGESVAIQQDMLAWLHKTFAACPLMVTTDATITLAAALGDKEGAIVIAGTGSIACGRDRHGRILRVGGWGSLFDDAGSGYDIGRRAIAAVLRAHDGRGKPTRLERSLCRELRLRKIVDVVTTPLTAQQISALSLLVQQDARAKDAVARSLCLEAAANLADLALTLIHQMGRQSQPVRIVCSGGVFQSSPMIRRAFARRVHDVSPGARISLLRREPVEGGLLLARRLAETGVGKQRAS
jgi:N-acetylglucosamine kinase-like BadF-type ATPase